MELRELAEKCKERDINCDGCPYMEICGRLSEILEDMSPIGLVEMVDENHIID